MSGVSAIEVGAVNIELIGPKKALKVKHEKGESVYNFEFHPCSEQITEVNWCELGLTAGGKPNILCHNLCSTENLNLSVTGSTKALVLVNTVENYDLHENICGLDEIHIPVVIVKKSDGLQIIHLLRSSEQSVEAALYCKDEDLVEDANMNYFEVPETAEKIYSSPDLAELRQRKTVIPKDSLLSLISENMYSSNNPVVLLCEHRFTEFISLVSHLEQNKKELVKKLKLKEIVEIIEKLSKHSEVHFRKDFLVYAEIIKIIKSSHSYNSSNKVLSQWTSDLLVQVEEMDCHDIAKQVHLIIHSYEGLSEGDNFFENLEHACFVMSTHYGNDGSKYSPVRKDQRSCLYSPMLWICLAMKFKDLYKMDDKYGKINKHTYWKQVFHLCRYDIVLDDNTSSDICECMSLAKELHISPQNGCKSEDFLEVLDIASKRKLRQFSELRVFVNLLKTQFQCSCKDIYDKIKFVRKTYYTRNSTSWKVFERQDDLRQCLIEGLEFLETLYQSLRDVSGYNEEGLEWIKVLLYLIDIKNIKTDPVKCYALLIYGKQEILVENHQIICQMVVESFKADLQTLKCWQIVEFHKRFYPDITFENENLLANFLYQYEVPENFSIDINWQEFFDEFAKYKDKFKMSICFVNFLKRCFTQCKTEESSVNFLVNLMKINTEDILSGLSERDQDILDTLFTHICRIMQRVKFGILSNIVEIIDNMIPTNSLLNEVIVKAVIECVLPELKQNIEKYEALLEKCNNILINDVSWIDAHPSSKFHLCWCIINYYYPEFDEKKFKETLDWVLDFQLSIGNKNIFKIYEFVQESTSTSPEIKRYFGWMSKLKEVLTYWIEKFISMEINFASIVYFALFYNELSLFRKHLHLLDQIPDICDINESKTLFSSKFSQILSHLVKSSISKSCMLHKLFQQHFIEIPYNILSFIEKQLSIYTKEQQLRQSNNEANELVLHEKCYDYIIFLHEDCTLNELTAICLEIEDFLRPLNEHLNMFVYFSLEGSHLFKNYLIKHTHKEQQCDDCELSFSPSLYSCDSDNSDSFKFTSVDTFSKVLENTKQSIHDILCGKINYLEIVSTLKVSDKSFLCEEIRLLKHYILQFDLAESYQQSLKDVEYMLQLFQYSPCIISLFEICKTFETFRSLYKDSSLEPLFSIAEELQTNGSKELTAVHAKEKLQTVKNILAIKDSLECLTIFPAILKSRDFYNFLCNQQFICKDGYERFKQKYNLITAQLQHEEYNEAVLNHLWVAYKIMVPFFNPTDLISLIKEIQPFSKGIVQLKTVNNNLPLIWKWFSKAEGDTRENIAKELKDIIKSGKFCFSHKKEESNVHMQKVELILLYDSSAYTSSSKNNGENSQTRLQSSKQSKQSWNSEQIKEFARKLGFLDKDNTEGNSFKTFLNLSKMAYKMIEHLQELTELGYPTDQIAPIPCSISNTDMDKIIVEMKQRVEEWKDKTSKLLFQHPKLLLMNMPKMLQIYGLITERDNITDADVKMIVHEVSYLVPNTSSVQKKLVAGVKNAIETIKHTEIKELLSPMILVGQFLDTLLIDDCNPTANFINSPKSEKYESQPLYSCTSLLGIDMLCLIIGIFNGIPEPCQILRCQVSTTEHEISLFWQRLNLLKGEYLILNFNKLPLKLQEFIVQLHMSSKNDLGNSFSVVHFLETSKSILHEIPWIELKDINSMKISREVAQDKCAFSRDNFASIKLIYGKPGCGKTHHIKKQLLNCRNHLTIAINEEFTASKAIYKLRSLPLYEEQIGIYFNITVLPPVGSDVESQNYSDLMESISWFFFDLLVLGYVEDKESGLSYCIPGELDWQIYIEVPSCDHIKDEASIDALLKCLPSLCLLGTKNHIEQGIIFEVDDDVQLVCKYLQAYDNGTINKLHKEHGPLVQFSVSPNLTESECNSLLQKYMPSKVKSSMITQRLFIKYMKRRCKFLDNMPGFQYNNGRGDVCSRMPVTGKALSYYDTTHLGSILMKAMLKEVEDFCDPNISKKWTRPEYQQLIYDFKDGGSSFGLLSLSAFSRVPSDFEEFQRIGIKPKSSQELNTRTVQDEFLSRALGVQLNSKNCLSAISDKPYVLTLDYTIKMLNIHERRECGMPVILEGETGVGKTALVEMLSDLWSQSIIMKWTTEKDNLYDAIRKVLRRHQIEQTSFKYITNVHEITFRDIKNLCSTSVGISGTIHKKILKQILPLRKNPIIHLLTIANTKCEGSFDSFSSIEALFDEACKNDSSIATANLLYYILSSEIQSTFHKINIHGALTLEHMWKLLEPAIKQANILNKKQLGHNGSPYYVTVFFDEVNTASCLGLFKEIITDRTFDGVKLPDNIFIVAACNPHRGNSLASHENNLGSRKTWIRGTYYVRSLHPSLHLLMWNYDTLTEKQEKHYISAKFSMQDPELHKNVKQEMTALIVDSQNLMREYAKQQLLKNSETSSLDEEMITKYSHSCVSQRDIQRVFTIYEWFLNFYLKSMHHGKEDYRCRAVLLAIGIVYYLRLDSYFRQKYIDYLDSRTLTDKLKFSKAFNEELDFFINSMDLPKGTAHTLALKENILATIVCTVTHTPLIIVGDPGSSKTFSFNQCVSNLKGEESVSKLFQDTKIFVSLDAHFYQCSYQTTSNEIETVFSRAINRQRSHCQFDLRVYCVVFMDEAGLPEESHESLKVLHQHLDKQEVSFVAITNHALDAAKTNRAVSLFRPKSSLSELKTLVYGCLRDEDTKKYVNEVAKLCKPYMEIMKKEWFSHLFGLRDFHHFIIHLKRNISKYKGNFSAENILQALKRNFSGSDRFEEIFEAFVSVFGKSPNLVRKNIKQGIVDVFKESLKDSSTASLKEFETNPVRYKLIIDPSEDNSLIHIILSLKSVNNGKVRMFFCSGFPSDGELETVNTIAAIRHCAGEGYTVVMCQSDDIHASFYDLFNQRFRKIDTDKDPSYYCNIAIGAHSEPSRVDPKFQCIIVIRKSELHTTPGPLLNRFEKYLISHQDILYMSLGGLPRNMIAIIKAAQEKAEEFLQHVNGLDSLYGYEKETLNSLLLDIVPDIEYKYSAFSKNHMPVNSSEKPFDFLCMVILRVLRKNAGFNIPEYDKEEFHSDANNLYNLQVHMNIQCDLETHDDALCAVEEAFRVLYSDESTYQDLTPDGVLVIWVVVQLIIRVLIKRLMQVMTIEAIVLKRNAIPLSYLLNYLKFQPHFSLRDTISKYNLDYEHNLLNETRSPNKLIVFTRSSSLLHDLPQNFSFPNDLNKEKDKELIKNYVYEDSNALLLYKLSNILSQTSIEDILNTFMESESKKILVFIANMQSTSSKIINHTRFMIEESEHQGPKKVKMFVLVLHFSPNQFFSHCYPTLFLREWDHYYLDTIANTTGKVNIPNWLQQCCFDQNELELDSDGSLYTVIKLLLQDIIPILSARMTFGNGSGGPFNCTMKPNDRETTLSIILMDFGLGEILCKRFCKYWKTTVMIEYLEKAAAINKKRDSVLNITDSIQTQLKAHFFHFCVYMLAQANTDCNLDTLYRLEPSSPAANLFLEIFKYLPLPELDQLIFLCSNLSPQQTSKQCFQFPFFSRICSKLEKYVDLSNEAINLRLGTSPEFETGFLISDSNHILQKMTDESFATIEMEDNEVLAAINSAGTDLEIWNCYLNDFMSYKLNLQNVCTDDHLPLVDIGSKILQEYFRQLADNQPKRLVMFHCYAKIFNINLAQMAHVLRPLEMTKYLPVGPHSFSETLKPQNGESLLKTMNLQEFDIGSHSHMAYFILSSLLNSLFTATYPTTSLDFADKDNGKLIKWFKCYRNILSFSSFKQKLYSLDFKDKKTLHAQFDTMHCIYIMILCGGSLSEDNLYMAAATFHNLITIYFNESLELVTEAIPSLQQILNIMLEMLSASNIAKKDSQRSIKIIIDELLKHHFSPYKIYHNEEDIQWFFLIINSQKQYFPPHYSSTDKMEVRFKCIEFSQIKLFVHQLLKSKNKQILPEPGLWHLKKCDLCVRNLIKNTILQSGSSDVSNSYIPFYYDEYDSEDNEFRKQPLCHIYFLVMLEKTWKETKKITSNCVIELVELANKIREVADKISENGEDILLQLELQAVIKVLLQYLAKNIDCDVPDKLDDILPFLEDIKSVIKYSSHQNMSEKNYQRVLVFHLLENLGGLQNLIANSNFVKQVKILDHMMQDLQSTKHIKFHHLSILEGPKLKKLYNEVSEIMQGIHYGRRRGKDQLAKIAQDWGKSKGTKEEAGILSFRMIVWFVTYNNYYSRKISSPALCSVFDDNSILQNQNCTQLILCFLDTSRMAGNGIQQSDNSQVQSTTQSSIFQLFNSNNPNQDQSDLDLKQALVNLIGVILGSSSQSNHLWYHLFSINDLENTFMTGFMYDHPVGTEGYTYDCGTELTLNGDFARRDYKKHAYRGTYTLHSLYLLLWTNFGTFCIALLTQKEAAKQLNDSIISSDKNVHDYCFDQMQMLWKLIKDKLKLTAERRSHFVKLALENVYQVNQDFTVNGKNIFKTSEELFEYEQKWHMLVYEPAWKGSLDEYIDLFNEKEHKEYLRIRELEECLPMIPCESELIHYTLCQDLNDLSEDGIFNCILRFATDLQQLQIGGELLPDLIELYRWIHINLSLRVTRQKAATSTIKSVIDIAVKHNSEDAGDHLKKLYDRIHLNCVHYHDCETSATTSPEAANRKKRIVFNNNTPLLYFLSDTELEDQGKDYLYKLVNEIIADHNETIQRFYSALKKINPFLIPDDQLEIHPSEVTSDCVIIHSTDQIELFHELLQSRYIPSFTSMKCLKTGFHTRRKTSHFDLNMLIEDIATNFICGKPLIRSETSFRTRFKFRKEKMGNKTAELKVLENTLSEMQTQLPDSLKSPLSSTVLSQLVYEFHAAGYIVLNDTVTFLGTVSDHLINQNVSGGSIEEMTISIFMIQVYEVDDFQVVLDNLKFHPGSENQKKLLQSLKLKFIYGITDFFYNWLEKGFYNFSSLPKYFKVNMANDVRSKIEVDLFLQVKKERKISDMIKEIQRLTGAFKVIQNELLKEVKDESKPMMDVLLKRKIIEKDNMLQNRLPKELKLHHYVDFRISLGRLLDRLQEETNECSIVKKWPEFVDNLWDEYLPHIREIIFKMDNAEFFTKQNIEGIDEIYGFPIQEEEASFKDELLRDLETEQTIPQDQYEYDSRTTKEIAYSTTVNDVCCFLKEINLQQYEEGFRDNEMDGSMLFDIKPEVLEDAGVSNPLHQVLISQLFKRKIEGKMPNFTIRHVMEFLSKNNLGKHAAVLEKSGIDGDMLMDINKDLMEKALVQLGLPALVARRICIKFETFYTLK